jgi:hypothetical protein
MPGALDARHSDERLLALANPADRLPHLGARFGLCPAYLGEPSLSPLE